MWCIFDNPDPIFTLQLMSLRKSCLIEVDILYRLPAITAYAFFIVNNRYFIQPQAPKTFPGEKTMEIIKAILRKCGKILSSSTTLRREDFYTASVAVINLYTNTCNSISPTTPSSRNRKLNIHPAVKKFCFPHAKLSIIQLIHLIRTKTRNC